MTDDVNRIRELAGDMAAQAQRVYDDWQQDENGWNEDFGEGGICAEIADGMSLVLEEQGYETEVVFEEGGNHDWLEVITDNERIVVDIPASTYEHELGLYRWRKIPGVLFNAEHIVVEARPREELVEA